MKVMRGLTSVKPASSRFRAIGAPTVPSPMKPILIASTVPTSQLRPLSCDPSRTFPSIASYCEIALDSPSSADFEDRPGYVVRLGTDEEGDCFCHVVGRTDPSHGRVLHVSYLARLLARRCVV